jgi:uncharacterized membrane protein
MMSLTAALGLIVLILAVFFAFNSGFYDHWYAFFRVIHVSFAVLWVGGGAFLTLLAVRAERANDEEELATIARQAAFAGQYIFSPAGAIVFLAGIALMINTDLGWGKFWIAVGLLGFISSFVTGVAVLAPMSKRITVLVEQQGVRAPETQALLRKILLIARVDVAVLMVVVLDMVTKPFA